jgi:very-short-patch-repair endonuclease
VDVIPSEQIIQQKKGIRPVETVVAELAERWPEIKMVESSYSGLMNEAVFEDPEFGPYRAIARDVLSEGRRHPEFRKRANSERAIENLKRAGEAWLSQSGLASPFHSREVQKRCRETFRAKYNGEGPGSSILIREKIRKTNREKYGVDYLFQDAKFRQMCFEISVKNGRHSSSKQERELSEFLLSRGVVVTKRRFWSEKRNKFLEFDLVCEQRKVAIEMNGLYFHSELFLDRTYHRDKMELARSLGYRFIMIWDFEWNQRREQVQNFILSALGQNRVRIGARKTECRQVPRDEARRFLDENHIQGSTGFKKAIGLYHNDELMMLVTIGAHHRRSNELVLSRMCAKTDVTVAGGFSKLCQAIMRENDSVTSWVDLRISQGESYIATGWSEISTIPIDYFYTDKRKIISKQSRKKSNVGTPRHMTEREHATRDGLIRVWDCGKKKFCLTPNPVYNED